MLSPEDATKVIQLILEADGHCLTCYGYLTRDAQRIWPEVDWEEAAGRIEDEDNRRDALEWMDK